jgi:hypothetical protein
MWGACNYSLALESTQRAMLSYFEDLHNIFENKPLLCAKMVFRKTEAFNRGYDINGLMTL